MKWYVFGKIFLILFILVACTEDRTVNGSFSNLPPLLDSLSCSGSIQHNVSFSCKANASDPEGKLELMFGSQHTCGSWLTIDSLTAQINGTPSPSDIGTCTINVVATDGKTQVNVSKNINVEVDDAEGSLDTSIGENGVFRTSFPSLGDSNSFLGSSALADDNKFIVSGSQHDSIKPVTILVAKFNLDGSLDTSFGGGDGFWSMTHPNWASTFPRASIKQRSDGKIYVYGYWEDNTSPSNQDAFLLRLTQDGELDTTFNAPFGYMEFVDAYAVGDKIERMILFGLPNSLE